MVEIVSVSKAPLNITETGEGVIDLQDCEKILRFSRNDAYLVVFTPSHNEEHERRK
mgnify:FL=1